MDPLPHLRRSTPASPERIIQFGTGRFLRGFVGFFVDRANKSGCYDGRIVAVQTTGMKRAQVLARQGGCFTLWTRDQGRDDLEVVESISRALAVRTQWDQVLELARSEHLECVVSNTTEIGLALALDDNITDHPPTSYPCKLAALLYERARHFDFDPGRGLVILPCELITGNGALLRSLVGQTAQMHGLDARFLPWLAVSTHFCDTLVDRIVPGTPPKAAYVAAERRLGRQDSLLITAESYRLWAIEGDATLRARIGFADADAGIVIANDIAPYHLRKVRILNGGHTLSVPLGLLAGNRTVLDNMTNPVTAPYIEALLTREIGPVVPVDQATVGPYINEVLLRWRNPHLVHRLLDITLQSTSKMKHRVMPSIQGYYRQYGCVPARIALGFAAFLLMMRPRDKWHEAKGASTYRTFDIRDDEAPRFRAWWGEYPEPEALVRAACQHEQLWGMDLASLAGWIEMVTVLLRILQKDGPAAAIGHIEEQGS